MHISNITRGCARLPLALLAAVALASAVASPWPVARGQSSADLSAAEQRAAALEARIASEQSSAQSLQGELRRLASAVGSEQAGLDRVRGDIDVTNKRVDAAKAHLDRLRNQVRSRVRAVYMRGPLEMIGVMLGSQTLNDFVRRAIFASRLAQRDSQVMLETRRVQSQLLDLQHQQTALAQQKASTLRGLRSRQDAMTSAFVRQQAILADLAKARIEALNLVDRLKDRLNLGGLARVAGQGMTISYGEWARTLLGAENAPVSRNNQVAVIAWEAAEGTMATWNPLATTYYMPGSTTYNSSGVRNYASLQDGIQGSKLTLSRGGHGYEPIVASLRRSADPMDTANAIRGSDWCSGCDGGNYVVAFVPSVEKYYDRFGGR